jgi:antitoxin (DNA-binding transcriptional repressor) of toxin-antitoxin stability system
MKAINVTELKAHLSKYLRQASRGARIVVKDRDEAIAQIGPPVGGPETWQDRLAAQGRLRLGSQEWKTLRVSMLEASIDIQESLRAVREEPGDVRRR